MLGADCPNMPKVFVSYSRHDRSFLDREIIQPLQGLGLDFWFDAGSIRTSDVWERRIQEGLRGCDWFLVLLSKNSVESDWVHAEVSWALENRKNRIVPILIGDCDISRLHLLLSRIQHLKFYTSPENGRKELISLILPSPIAPVGDLVKEPERVGTLLSPVTPAGNPVKEPKRLRSLFEFVGLKNPKRLDDNEPPGLIGNWNRDPSPTYNKFIVVEPYEASRRVRLHVGEISFFDNFTGTFYEELSRGHMSFEYMFNRPIKSNPPDLYFTMIIHIGGKPCKFVAGHCYGDPFPDKVFLKADELEGERRWLEGMWLRVPK